MTYYSMLTKKDTTTFQGRVHDDGNTHANFGAKTSSHHQKEHNSSPSTRSRVSSIVKNQPYPPGVIETKPSIATHKEASNVQNRAPIPQCVQNESINIPSKSDVLCGRGGAINNHLGNIYFRSLVNDRKVAYKSCSNKARKAKISLDIITRIKCSGGRYLEREKVDSPTTGESKVTGYWVEVDNVKAMSKTSQALREVTAYTRTRVDGVASLRRKRISKSQQFLIYTIPDKNYSEMAEPNLHPLKKTRLTDTTAICDDDHSTQESILTARVETKQEAIGAKDITHSKTYSYDQRNLHQSKQGKEYGITVEAFPRPILDEIAHPSPSYTCNPIFRIEEPIVYPPASNSYNEIAYPPRYIRRFNSLGFANDNLDVKTSFTNLFQNEEDSLNTHHLETAQECHLDEDQILTMPLPDSSTTNTQESLYLEYESCFEK